jgi:hypothetical protein
MMVFVDYGRILVVKISVASTFSMSFSNKAEMFLPYLADTQQCSNCSSYFDGSGTGILSLAALLCPFTSILLPIITQTAYRFV